jgi:hypothetical protein
VLSNPGRGIYGYVNYNKTVAHVPTSSQPYRQTPDSCYRFTGNGDLWPDVGAFKSDAEALWAAIHGMPQSTKRMNPEDLNQTFALQAWSITRRALLFPVMGLRIVALELLTAGSRIR